MVRDRSIELVRDGGLTAVPESIGLDNAQTVLETTLNVRAARPPGLTESDISELAMKLPHVVSIIDLRILRRAENRGVAEPCCERLRMQLPPDFERKGRIPQLWHSHLLPICAAQLIPCDLDCGGERRRTDRVKTRRSLATADHCPRLVAKLAASDRTCTGSTRTANIEGPLNT